MLKRVNWRIVHSNISEALEELQGLEKKIKQRKCDEIELQLSLQHAYHHLNFAWNIRRVPTKRYVHLTQEEFDEWRKYPAEIEDDELLL